MEDWTRVVLYGTYDGFVRSTVESLKIAVRLDSGERVEIPSECVMSADKIVKKDEIKLKDVIKRIKCFDLVTKAVWVNEILNDLGSGFGLHKYHEGYKQGKLEGAMEREKVVVPQFVADWIERSKQEKRNIRNALNNGGEKMRLWFLDLENYDTFVRAWLDGYTVGKEKRYLVKIIGITNYNSYLNYHKGENKWTIESRMETDAIRTEHTRKELEEAGFGWVFDCPGIEIEEVEE